MSTELIFITLASATLIGFVPGTWLSSARRSPGVPGALARAGAVIATISGVVVLVATFGIVWTTPVTDLAGQEPLSGAGETFRRTWYLAIGVLAASLAMSAAARLYLHHRPAARVARALDRRLQALHWSRRPTPLAVQARVANRLDKVLPNEANTPPKTRRVAGVR